MVVVAGTGASTLHAQAPGPALIQQALDGYFVTLELEPDSAIALLWRGLDPAQSSGPSWAEGVQAMVQILEENGRPRAARAWARWAMHREPTLALSSLNLGPQARAMFEEARRAPGPSGVARLAYRWTWPDAGTPDDPGRVDVETTPPSLDAAITVTGVGSLQSGGRSLATDVYEITVAGAGFDTVRVPLAVLPGITTHLGVVPVRTIAAVADSSLRPGAAYDLRRALIAVTSTRFESPETCEWGVAVGRHLILTRYDAIRGASTAALATGGDAPSSPTVARHRSGSAFAILRTTSPVDDTLSAGGGGRAPAWLWLLGGPGCEPSDPVAVRVATSTDESVAFRAPAVPDPITGRFAIDRYGTVVGAVTAARTITRFADAAAELRVAERNAAPLAVGEVARRENHTYGGFDVQLERSGTVTVEPLERWHWPELARSFAGSGTFVGPVGRYRVDVSDAGMLRWSSEVMIRPAEIVPVRASAQVATEPQLQITPGKRKFPVALALLGAAGAAAGAAALLLLGGGDGPSGGGSGVGSVPITIAIP